MFSPGILHPYQSLHGTLYTDTARKSQEALQVGIQLLSWHWEWEGRGILLRNFCDSEIVVTFHTTLTLLTMPLARVV